MELSPINFRPETYFSMYQIPTQQETANNYAKFDIKKRCTANCSTSLMYIVSYNCFLLKSFIAINNPKIDIATESRAGIIKSDGTTSPESKSTFFDVNMNGLN